MISVQTIQMLTIGGVVGGTLGFLGAIPYLKSKGVNVDKALETASTVLNAVEPALDAAKEFLPGNPALNLIDFIDKQAIKAAKGAQQLNNSSQLTDDKRKQTAQESVYAALKEIGIESTDSQKKLIDDAIEAAVYDLPHKPVDVKQLQSTIDQQTIQYQQLQQENTQLKQTINTITTAASAVQTTTQIQ